jgi:iron-sulfur cluster repair protein YtfE (RIC family)
MTPSQIRKTLLEEHAGLRARFERARGAIAEGRASGKAPDGLRECLEELSAALRAHNQNEETVLRELLRDVDAWGPARADIMDESHVEEHDELLGALLAANGAADPEAVARDVVSVIDRLEEHMVREEEILLAEDVLRDDDVVIEYFGG